MQIFVLSVCVWFKLYLQKCATGMMVEFSDTISNFDEAFPVQLMGLWLSSLGKSDIWKHNYSATFMERKLELVIASRDL